MEKDTAGTKNVLTTELWHEPTFSLDSDPPKQRMNYPTILPTIYPLLYEEVEKEKLTT